MDELKEMKSFAVGSYYEVKLRDGGRGNYEIAREYYREFRNLAKDRRLEFNRLCAHILANPEAPLEHEHKAILALTKFAWQTEYLAEAMLLKPEDEIKDFVCLAVKRGFLNRIFTACGRGTPQYYLLSPFKTPCFQDDQVSVQYRKEVNCTGFMGEAEILSSSRGKLRIDQ